MVQKMGGYPSRSGRILGVYRRRKIRRNSTCRSRRPSYSAGQSCREVCLSTGAENEDREVRRSDDELLVSRLKKLTVNPDERDEEVHSKTDFARFLLCTILTKSFLKLHCEYSIPRTCQAHAKSSRATISCQTLKTTANEKTHEFRLPLEIICGTDARNIKDLFRRNPCKFNGGEGAESGYCTEIRPHLHGYLDGIPIVLKLADTVSHFSPFFLSVFYFIRSPVLPKLTYFAPVVRIR